MASKKLLRNNVHKIVLRFVFGRSIGFQAIVCHPFLSELINHPGILQPVSNALGCHNLVCSSLAISTRYTRQCASRNSQNDSDLLYPTEGIAVHVAFAHARHMKCDLKSLPCGLTSEEEVGVIE